MDITLNLTGGTHQTKSKKLSSQVTRNFWPRIVDNAFAMSGYILDSWVGMKEFVTTTGNADRGSLEHRGILYKVTENTLYSIAEDGTITALGAIDIEGADQCIMFGAGASVVIVTGGVAYEWDGTNLTKGTDGSFETPNSGAYLNKKAIYDGDEDRYVVTNVNDFLTIGGLSYGEAEGDADELIRVYTYDQRIYMLGAKTIEPYWDSGVGSPPIDRIEGGMIPVGLAALHAVGHNKNFMYIFDSNREVQAIKGSDAQTVSTAALNKIFQNYAKVDDAIIWCMRLEGQNFVVLTFPVMEKTWVYPEGGEWFEWSSGAQAKRALANSYAYAYGKHLVGDYSSGKMFELDFDTYDDDGAQIIRQRDSAPLHSGIFGVAGKNVELNRFELILETGVGLLSGQGQNPKIILQISYDGGNTFGTEMFGEMGKLGEYQWKLQWHALGSAENIVIRLKVSDPVYTSILGAAADITLGI